ncbi:hypothetical protein J6590_063733, partial [Homalodisca vitripennis]
PDGVSEAGVMQTGGAATVGVVTETDTGKADLLVVVRDLVYGYSSERIRTGFTTTVTRPRSHNINTKVNDPSPPSTPSPTEVNDPSPTEVNDPSPPSTPSPTEVNDPSPPSTPSPTEVNDPSPPSTSRGQ